MKGDRGMDPQLLTVHATPTGETRLETMMGVEYRVVPAVLVRSQVLTNNLGVTFLPPEEITPAWAGVWNGSPVIVGDHPTERGAPKSARDPAILNARGVGFVFDARAEVDGDTRRVAGEVWLNTERAGDVPELAAILSLLDEGKPVELSTGFPTLGEEVQGAHNGKAYDMVLRPQGADHLAVFAELTGACSVTDGCGLGVNHDGSCEEEETPEDAPATNTDPVAEGPTGATDTPESTEMDESDSPAQTPDEAAREGWFQRIYNRLVEHLKSDLPPLDAGNESDEDRRRMLHHALRDTFGGPGKDAWIEAVFSDEGVVIFEIESQAEGTGLFRSEFSIDDNGEIALSDAVPVRRVTTFEPVTNSGPGDAHNEEDDAMNRDQMLAQLAEAGPLDREALEKLTDCQLKGLINADAEAPEGAGTEAQAENTAQGAGESETAARLAELQERLDAQEETIAELRSATAPAVEERERERTELVEELAGNARVAFDKEELEGMSFTALQKLRATARGESYAGRGGPKVSVNAEPAYAEPVPYFAETAQKEGD